MTNKIFVSLTSEVPKGFESGIPSIEEASRGCLCILAESLDDFTLKMGFMKNDMTGMVLTKGKSFGCSKLTSGLWHMTYPENEIPLHADALSCFLEIICNEDLDTCMLSLKDSEDDLVYVLKSSEEEIDSLNREKEMLIKAQKALQESEENYRSIFNATNEAIFIHDSITGKILDVNNRMLEMFGYTHEEVLSQNIETFSEGIPPYSRNEALEFIKKTINEGPQVFDWVCRKKDGSLFLSEVSLKKVKIGAIEKIIAVTRDISDRKKTEEALYKSERLFRGYFELGLTGMSTTTPDKKWVHFNDRLCEILDYSREELQALTWDSITDPKNLEEETRHFEKLISGESDGYTMDKRYIRKDGSIAHVNISVSCLKNQKNEVEYLIAMIQDITERKKAEKALRKSEALLYSTIESLPFDILALDENEIFILQNSVSRKIWGNVIGKTPSVINTDPENLKIWKRNNQRAYNGEQVVGEIEYDINGSKTNFYQIIVPIFPDSPQKGIVGVNIDITKRKKAEEALAENEERLRTLINSMPDIVCFKDGEGKWLEANDFYIKLMGLEGVDYRGKRNSELAEFNKFYRDTLKIRDDSDEKTWELGVTTRKDEIIPQKDGSVMVFDNIKIPMFYPDGRRRGLIKVGRDITERKNIEETLIQSQLNFETFFETVNDLIFILDENGIIIHVNDSVIKRLEFSEKELLGIPISDILECQQPDCKAKLLNEMFAGIKHDSRIHLISKKKNPIEVDISTFKGEWNSKPAVFWISRDITELKLSEKKFSTAFNSNSAVMAISTVSEGRYIDINDTFVKVSGYTREEILGQRSTDLGIFDDPSDREEIKRIFQEKGQVRDFEAKLRGKNGNCVYGILSMDKFNLGDEPCWLTVMTDITDRKQAEAEKLEMERRLLHAQKLESLGVLAGGIAHDFNNLLTGILGNLDLALLTLPSGSQAKTRIEQAIQASYRAEELTRQMLAYSGKGKFEIKQINISGIVKENAELFRASIARTVTLDLSVKNDLPFIEADPGQIQQIIMNLITNAAEAIGSAPGVISLTTGVMECSEEYLKQSRLEEKPEQGIFAFLDVTDNGCGMDKETERRIFEPFFTTKFTGRGLGMAAVLGIIRGHHGAIILDSEPGKGSTFKVLFPVSGNNSDGYQNAGMSKNSSDIENTGTILVIDDEDHVRELCIDFLRVFGFNTLSASNGYEGLQTFKENSDKIICVILDLTMPGLDGAATFMEIKRIKPEQKVILSSGYSEHEATILFANKGLTGFIQKPYRLGDLKEKINMALK